MIKKIINATLLGTALLAGSFAQATVIEFGQAINIGGDFYPLATDEIELSTSAVPVENWYGGASGASPQYTVSVSVVTTNSFTLQFYLTGNDSFDFPNEFFLRISDPLDTDPNGLANFVGGTSDADQSPQVPSSGQEILFDLSSYQTMSHESFSVTVYTATPPTNIPEPAGLALISIGLLAMRRRR